VYASKQKITVRTKKDKTKIEKEYNMAELVQFLGKYGKAG
jgi:hypothetical protein